MVAEVGRNPKGTPKVTRIWAAVDAGQIINPEIVRQQIEGGIIFGLSAALYGEITFEDGSTKQSNFDGYPVLRAHECPEIYVNIIASSADPTGVGELAVPPVAPAVAGAWAQLTGQPVSRLPMVRT